MRNVFFLAALISLACDPQPQGPIKPRVGLATLEVEAVDIAGQPVAGASFVIQGRAHNVTDAEGKFYGTLEVKQDEIITFDIKPPEGFTRGSGSASRADWQRKIHLPKKQGSPIQLSFKADFKRPRQDAVVMVHVSEPGVSVQINNKGYAQTGAGGLAQATFNCTPGEKLLVRAGRKLRWEGVCVANHETYIITESYQGPISEIERKDGEDPLPKGREGRELAKMLEKLRAGEGINEVDPVVRDRHELQAILAGIKARVGEGKGISGEESGFLAGMKPYQVGYLDGIHTLATQKAREKQFKALIPQLLQLIQSSRFKGDGELWFMLARAYEQEGSRAKALMSLIQVEAAMRGFSSAQKRAVMELHTRLLDEEFAAQEAAKPETVNLNLLKMAKARYEQLKQLNPGDGAIEAKLKALNERLKLPELAAESAPAEGAAAAAPAEGAEG
ncbi:hypothetical protein KKF91_18815 [Myxococcota bacterium]|nr:hypothetical protein [Myxococcota bacterium]MBU1432596.1 hypothetical protein [Myxococcota bacterium]MBU1896584.1 hypothetical protein [Myxococcota bacterium]